MRGVRQRRPSENVNKHRGAWSFLCATPERLFLRAAAKRIFLPAAAKRPALLREDIKVSLEFEFGISDGKKRRQECLRHNRAENRNAPARPGRSGQQRYCTTMIMGGKLKIRDKRKKSQRPHPCPGKIHRDANEAHETRPARKGPQRRFSEFKRGHQRGSFDLKRGQPARTYIGSRDLLLY